MEVKMEVYIAVLLWITVCAAEGEQFSQKVNGAPKVCDDDSSCPTGKYCAESKDCLDCHRCLEYNREELDPRVRSVCIKSARDCGKCLPGFEMERCGPERFCYKCVKAEGGFDPPDDKNKATPPVVNPPPVVNSQKVESSVPPPVLNSFKVEQNSWFLPTVAVSILSFIGVVSLISLGFYCVWTIKKKRISPLLPLRGSGRESPRPLLPRGPKMERSVSYGHPSTIGRLRESERQQQAQPFNFPSEAYLEASSAALHGLLPTAPPLSTTEDSNAGSSGGSTAPSNWQPSSHTVPLENCPVQFGGQDTADRPAELSPFYTRIVGWIQQLPTAVSESSVFSTRDESVLPPDSFSYRSVGDVRASLLPRASSVTVFNPAAYPSRRTLDSGIGTLRGQSPSPQSVVSAEDLTLELDFAVAVRVPAAD